MDGWMDGCKEGGREGGREGMDVCMCVCVYACMYSFAVCMLCGFRVRDRGRYRDRTKRKERKIAKVGTRL